MFAFHQRANIDLINLFLNTNLVTVSKDCEKPFFHESHYHHSTAATHTHTLQHMQHYKGMSAHIYHECFVALEMHGLTWTNSQRENDRDRKTERQCVTDK